MRMILKIVGALVVAFVIYAFVLEMQERSKPDQSFARSLGMTEANCVKEATEWVQTGMRQITGAYVGASEAREAVEQKCSKRVPW